jgi:glutamate formiminotransferase / 5-formyltetrahydrofolate cyclo-ligase
LEPLVIECVVNISEGRRHDVVARLADACSDDLLDVHTDADHNRSVFTLMGTDAPRRLAAAAVTAIDLTEHTGVHPRLGVVDVVPFVAIGQPVDDARRARDEFAQWAGTELALPCFAYDDQRPLPEVRRRAFVDLRPDVGPDHPHPTAGACAVGVRDVLVAYNVWLPGDQIDTARRIARDVRSAWVRALGLTVGDRVQVSMNLVAPTVVGPQAAFDDVAALARAAGTHVTGAELVGLLPAAVLDSVDPSRWDELDVGPDRTIEYRVGQRASGPAS